ncbi:LIC_13076 family protein [Leptospira yasudae]|uniref:Lipoprotein n=1 Tax=Leptospira yasudae TaxID=2202201 RepID=A0ABX9M313_9LEPT|nr:hypothetical protein [Leptospira yasudae]RHX79524.1 hypothetical protein DLM77_11545 [Leptospira yasudae]
MQKSFGILHSVLILSGFRYFLLLSFLLFSCSTIELNSVRGGENAKLPVSPQKDSNVSENVSFNCKPSIKKSQWYVLFGSVPINQMDYSEILPDSNKTYRVNLKTTWLDGILSTVLGIAASITRKTIEVESCDSRELASSARVPAMTPNLQQDKELSKADLARLKEDFIKQNEKQWKEELQEKIHSSLSQELESSWNKEIKHSKNLSVLFLKSGEIAKGTVTRIDGDGVKLFYKGKERVFRRADVQRVRFQD